MNKYLIFLLFGILYYSVLHAQSNYAQTNFRSGQSAYNDISGSGTAIAMTDPVSGASSTAQNIGFSFSFHGTAFTQFMIHADGILRLGTVAPGASTDIAVSPANSYAAVFTSTAPGFQQVIMPFFTNLVAGSSAPQFHVQTTGTAPDRVCTIQWKNLRDADNAGGGTQHQFSNLEFQVKLYETSNDIEFVYGPFTPSATALFTRNAACGIKATGTSFLGLYRINAVTPYQKAVVLNPTHHGLINSSYPFRRDMVPSPGFSNRFFGRLTNDVNVASIYYDSITTAGTQNSGRLDALVVNEGTQAISDITVTLQISGVNTHNAVVNIPSLAAGASQRVAFPDFTAANKGQQIVQVTAAAAGDERAANNQLHVRQVISQSHHQTPDFSINGSLGVGFNGSSGGFAAIKIYGSGTRKIRQIRIPFVTYRSVVGVRIYEDGGAGGSPSGSPLFTSPNFFTTPENFLLISLGEGITVNGNFFVAVQQNSTSNMGWRVFANAPRRNERHYNSNAGITWGLDNTTPPWEQMIEVYEESAGQDIGIETLTAPGCTYSESAEVKVNLRNFSANQIDFGSSPTTITGAVRGPDGVEIPFSVLKNSGTLAAGAAMEITVLNQYNYAARGNHLFVVRTNLPGDAERGNDSLRFVINNNIAVSRSITEPVCPLTSVTLTGPAFLSNLQWNVDGFVTSGTTRVVTPIKTTVVKVTGTDYRNCLLEDSVILMVKGDNLPPRPVLLFGDTVLSHRNGFKDTVRVKKLEGHTIKFHEFFANGTVVGDSAYALTSILGMNGAKVAAAYIRTSDGCANLSDTITYRYAPGVLHNNAEPLVTCDTSYYDSGGPVSVTGGNFTRTFTPSVPGTKMKLTFYRLDLAINSSIQVFDGPTAVNRIVDLRSPQNGNIVREFISSHETGALTVQFSFGSSNAPGWWAGLTCYTPEVYRTVASGNWITASTWERKAPGGSFKPATRPPAKGDDSVYIRHLVTLTSSTPMDQVVVEESGTLNLENPTSGFISMPVYKTVPQPEFLVKGTLNISPRIQIFGANGRMIIEGSLNNFGQIDLDTVVFNGTTPQVLGNFSGAGGTMRILRLDNPAGLTLGSDQTVRGIHFVNGMLQTNSENLITLSERSSFTTGARDNAHVNGPVAVSLPNALGTRLYPIGSKGRYRPVILANTNANTEGGNESVIVSLQEGPPPAHTLPAGISRVSALRYYRITRTGTPNALDFVITLPYLEDDGVTDPNSLTIAKDNGAGAWIDIGGVASGSVPGNIQSSAFNNFSDFVLANKTGGDNPLPVTWLRFTAIQKGDAVELEWRTTQEIRCGHYEVERSTDGNHFEKLATLDCLSGQPNPIYRYKDVPGKGTYFYRIRQVDTDGRFSFSTLQRVSFGSQEISMVYPNPTRGLLYLTGLEGSSDIRIYDGSGRMVWQSRNGQPNTVLHMGHLPAGIYQLTIIFSDGRQTVQKIQKLP